MKAKCLVFVMLLNLMMVIHSFGKEELEVVQNIEIGKYGGQIIVTALGDPKTFNVITANETSSTDIIGSISSFMFSVKILSNSSEFNFSGSKKSVLFPSF